MESKPQEGSSPSRSAEKSRGSTMGSFVKNTKEELRSRLFWRAVFGEFLASILFILGAILPVLGFNLAPPSLLTTSSSFLHIAFGVGITVALLAHAFWDISGGNFNPAVTIALLTARQFSVIRFVFYLIAQMCGSLVGAGLLYGYTPSNQRAGLGVLGLHTNLSLAQGFFLEFTATFIFILVIMSTTDPRKTNPGFLPPLAIGLAIFLGHLMLIPYTGACLNPIRQFGPAVVMNNHKNHWLYWLAPLSAGVVAPLAYQFILTEKPQPEGKQSVEGISNGTKMDDKV